MNHAMISDKLVCLFCIISWQCTLTHAQFEPLYLMPLQRFGSSVFGWVLQRHVIKTFSSVVSLGQCIMECSVNNHCYSLNYYPNNGVCELNNATHISHPGHYVQSSHGSFLLYFFRHMTTCDDSLCGSDKRCFLEQEGTSRLCKDCSFPLGLEDGTITDSAMSASSSYGQPSYPSLYANRARLNSAQSWASFHLSAGEFLQVDLIEVKVVTKVATQGRPGNQMKYVTKYTINWSMDKETWQEYQENGVVKVFDGNFDQHTVVTNSLKDKLTTRHVRLVVQQWYSHIELRMELYGCPIL